MYFNYSYDFQRVLYENPELISVQFQLIKNIQTKYRVINYNFYNFDKTGFMIDQICPSIVIIYTDQCKKAKGLQLDNQEQVIVIIYINNKDQSILLFLVIQDCNYFANQYSKTDFPSDQAIKTINNDQTDNKTGLEQIKHFDKHTVG